MVDSTDDLSRLLILSREQNGRDKIDDQSRPREPRTWALGKVDRDEQERSLSDTLKRPPRLSLARPTTSEEQLHERHQRRGQHWEKLPLHSATVQHATEKSLKTAIGRVSDPAALPTSSPAPSTFTDGLPLLKFIFLDLDYTLCPFDIDNPKVDNGSWTVRAKRVAPTMMFLPSYLISPTETSS